jgi:hypothetical protein
VGGVTDDHNVDYEQYLEDRELREQENKVDSVSQKKIQKIRLTVSVKISEKIIAIVTVNLKMTCDICRSLYFYLFFYLFFYFFFFILS